MSENPKTDAAAETTAAETAVETAGAGDPKELKTENEISQAQPSAPADESAKPEAEGGAPGEVVQFPGKAKTEPDPANNGAPPPMAEQSEADRAAQARQKKIEDEDQVLLRELSVGQTRVLKEQGAGRLIARKVMDDVTGEESIDRFVDYGKNPFKPIYMLPGQIVIEAAPVRGGVLVKYDDSMVFVPGAKLDDDGNGFSRIV